MDKINLQLGAIQPDKTIPPGMVFVPAEIEIQNGFVRWATRRLRFKPVKNRMLNTFAELHSKDDQAILKFARQWGVLGLCEHGMPASHQRAEPGTRFGVGPCELVESRESSMHFEEPVSRWKQWSSACDAALQIAAWLNQETMPDEHIPDNCWDRLAFGRARLPSPTDIPAKENRLVFARRILEHEVNGWLRLGAAGVLFAWNTKSKRWEMSLHANAFPNLFGAIAMALAMTVSGSVGVATCTACESWYTPETRPVPGRNNFCSKCRSGPKMWAALKRQQRARVNQEEKGER